MKNYFKDIIALFTASVQNEDMKRKFHQWLIDEEHADEKDAALYDYWVSSQGSSEDNVEMALQKIYEKAGDRSLTGYRSYWLKPLRYAAIIAVLISASVYITYYYTKKTYTQIATIENYVSSGQMRLIELPDGSKVQVNSGSLLLYPEKFVGNTRTVFLVGEANFKVKKNPEQPFIVRSSTMAVTALGTEFNISSYSDDEEITATLLEGKVKVVCGVEGKSYLLEPGQQVIYNKEMGASRLCKAELEDVTAWQRGELVFSSVTVEDMLVILQRRFDVHFHYRPGRFNEDKYNIRFSDKASFEEVLKVMKAVIGNFQYRIVGEECYIQ